MLSLLWWTSLKTVNWRKLFVLINCFWSGALSPQWEGNCSNPLSHNSATFWMFYACFSTVLNFWFPIYQITVGRKLNWDNECWLRWTMDSIFGFCFFVSDIESHFLWTNWRLNGEGTVFLLKWQLDSGPGTNSFISSLCILVYIYKCILVYICKFSRVSLPYIQEF